jgi:hypothetical protein
MAELRLMLVIALASCRASEAGPSSGLTPPAGWKPLPELATAARDGAKHAGVTIDGVEAWGEPARGCYGAWLGMHAGAGSPAAIANAMLQSMPPELAVTDLVKPAGSGDAGILSLAFARAPYTGRVRAQLTKTGLVSLVACYWNAREPAACEAACSELLGGLK